MNVQRKPQSRQEILRQQQQQTFVGREDQLKIFRDNLRLPPESWCFLFGISGLGGVGKSTLVRQFRKIVEEEKFITAYVSESENSVLEVMARLGEQLEQQGHKLNQFSERYKVYRQKKQELEADPDAPQGLAGLIGKSAAKAGLGLAKQIPGSGAVTPFLDEDVITAQVCDWASFVAKKIGNKDEVWLVQEPLEVLTPLFLQDLWKIAEKVNLVLFFDTYERTSGFLDLWFREILEERYGYLPINLIWVIAGMDELEKNKWCDFEAGLTRIPLEPFREEEARDYLTRKGITNEQVIEVILKLSGRLPLLVATLAVESPKDPSLIEDPSDTAVERFLKWVEKPEYRQIALNAALLPTFNRDTIAVISSEDRAEELFNWLKQMPFIANHRDGWTYHDIVRVQMLRYKRRNSLKSWADLHEKIADSYDALRQSLKVSEEDIWTNKTYQNYFLSTLYHRICQSPEKYFSMALNTFCILLTNKSFELNYAEIVLKAGKDLESLEIQDWGEQLIYLADKLNAYKEDQLETLETILTKLINNSSIESSQISIVKACRGNTYRAMAQYEKALKDFNQAIELEPKFVSAITNRGLTHHIMKHYENALKDFSLAVKLDPESALIIASRGQTYQVIGQYEEALKDFSLAVELDPKYALPIATRGETYRLMEQYEEALKDFNNAIELEPKCAWVIAIRGETYRLMKQYEEALKDFNNAIELEPKSEWIMSRSLTYLSIQRYVEALKDFDRVIEIYPENYGVIALRGRCYLKIRSYNKVFNDFNLIIEGNPIITKVSDDDYYYRAVALIALGRNDEAKTDLHQAIKLVQEEHERACAEWDTILSLALYYLVAGDFTQAETFFNDGLSREISKSNIQLLIDHLEDLLNILPDATAVKLIKEKLEARLVGLVE